jgi:hypothetical protein
LNFASCAQTSTKPIVFNEIGWSITLPDGFKIIDSSGMAASMTRGKASIDTSIYKKIEPSERKILIAAKKGSNAFMSFLTPFDEAKDGSWLSSNQLVRQVMFQTLTNKFPSIQFDSTATVETIASLTFNKFVIKGIDKGKVVYNSVMLSKLYNGKDFEISYVYVDDIVGKEIEEMLRQSKFN